MGNVQHTRLFTHPSEFIAKQVPCPPDTHSKQEPNVRTLWPDTRMIVSPTKLIVHFAKAEPITQSASPSHMKTGKSGNSLRLCGEFWQHNSKFSSLKEMTQVHSLSLRSTSVHKFSASRIADTAWENQCSNLPLLETNRCLLSLLLIGVFLVFLMRCCNRSSLKPARPMCDGRPFRLPALSPPGGSRLLFSRFPFFDGLYNLRSLWLDA